MQVVIVSYGSSGDVYPLITLGKELRRREHAVLLVCPSHFREVVEAAGLEWMGMFENAHVPPVRDLMEAYSHVDDPLKLLKAMHKLTLPAFDETVARLEERMPETDCMVTSYLFSNLNAVAERHGIPTLSLAFAHNIVPHINEPPTQVPSLRWLPGAVRSAYAAWAWRMGDRYVTGKLRKILRQAHKRNGLAPMASFFRSGARRMLVAVSPALFEPKQYDRDHFAFCGFLPPPTEVEGSLDPELLEFLGDDKVPLLTFGSVSPRGGLRALQHFADQWPSERKLLIQAGWVDMDGLDVGDNIRVIGSVPHDVLFPHVSVAAYHGGAGTTASLLRHGIPTVPIPHIADQRFWASELVRIGAAAPIQEKEWHLYLGEKLLKVEEDTRLREGAQRAASTLTAENGPSRAADHIEAVVAFSPERDPDPAQTQPEKEEAAPPKNPAE